MYLRLIIYNVPPFMYRPILFHPGATLIVFCTSNVPSLLYPLHTLPLMCPLIRPLFFIVSSDTTIIEMTGLTPVEVKELVGRYLGNSEREIVVSDELIQKVVPS